jgi:hypothetical protein
VPRLVLAPALLLWLLLVPAAASAQTVTAPASRIEALAPGEQVPAHRPIDFRVRTTAPAGSVVVRISGAPDVTRSGLLDISRGRGIDLATSAGSEPEVHVAQTPRSFLVARRPGPYYWQAYLVGAAAEGADEPIGDVQTVTVEGPRPSSSRLYPRFGPRGRAAFYLSSAHFPSTVGGPRFRSVVRAAAHRWHLRSRTWTSLAAGRPDGYDVVGFGKLPGGVLGLETDYTIRGRVVEQDVRFNAAAPWNQGPGYPDFDEMDLESVVIHELGHMAGVRRHNAHCTNSPMIEALALGEWWRGPHDDWFFGCGGGAAAASTTAWRFQTRAVALG